MTKATEDASKKNAVVMGRKTWESIPVKMRPLPGRENIVLSRRVLDIPNNAATVCSSFASAVEALSSPPLCDTVESVWIIGGSSLYKEAMQSPLCHRIYLTRILKHYDCDVFLPDIPASFVRIKDSRVPEEKQEENDVEYYHEVYEKQEQVVDE
ncbi:dihydrofolate reductase-like isoform X2 [Bacillus rossius redtenbacheri]